MDDFINEFIAETQEGLTALDNDLVALSAQPDDKGLLDRIFRTLHTIKGTCGFLGLVRLEAVAHIAETFLDGFRKGGRLATPDDVALILRAMDHIRFLVDEIGRTSAEPAGDDSALIAAVQAAIDGVAAPASSSAPASEDVAADDAALPVLVENNEAVPAAAAAPASSGGGPDAASQFLRIHVDRLEEMLALVSELVLARNRLNQSARGIADDVLEEPLQRLDSVVGDLQDSVMKARMQPIGNAWAKFPRIIHEIARETGKAIRLTMTGEDTDVDRQVLELIKDPLLHMVRNSADHGIEDQQTRRASGKPETGTVSLSAWHERGYVVIEIRDDGKGLSPDRIRDTAIKRGIATAEQLAQMNDREVLSFIFAPGFSTAQTVTAFSGRGVGMDVVRTNIEKAGGIIDLDSVVGQGSRFTIRIPLTLAIVPALLLAAGAQRYAMPQMAVQEVIRINHESAERIESPAGYPVLRLRDILLPLVDLDGLLTGRQTKSAPDDCHVMVIHTGALRFGVIVDHIVGTEDVVVKPVPVTLRSMAVFAGNTILGDGQVVMILDPSGIAAQARLLGRAGVVAASPAADKESMADDASMVSYLLFNAADDTPKAVPAFLVTRIAEFARDALEKNGDKIVVQHQGHIVELHDLGRMPDGDMIKVLIFSDEQAGQIFGVMIDAVGDIIRTNPKIEDAGRRAGYLGAAVIAGRSTDILDINYFMDGGEWLTDDALLYQGRERRRVLLVDDSAFFRHMLQPLLNMAGYVVTVASGPKSALALCERGLDFDIIVSDIEMEEMDGLAFAETVKGDTRWKNIPMVALSAHATPQDKERGYSKGFSAYVSKSDKEELLSTLRTVFEQNSGGER